MLRIRLTVALVLLSTPLPSFAQTKKEDWPAGSAVRTMMERTEQLETLDRQLNAHSARVAALIDNEHINIDLRLLQAVARQNEAWRVFRSSDCDLAGAIIGGGGAWPSAHAAECEVGQTIARIKILDSVVSCINDLEPEQRRYNSFECLEKLKALPGVE